MPRRAFLLSPARCDGARARLLFNPGAEFALARALRETAGVAIGEVFSFLSGLYFRGKLTYARAFAARASDILVITTDRGLVDPELRVTIDDLRAFADVDIAAGDARYLGPLERDAASLAEELGVRGEAVLLGSVATGKYADVLVRHLGERVLFPTAFVGRGDMSRGGLLLRHARSGEALDYAPIAGAVRTGQRPPKLERVR